MPDTLEMLVPFDGSDAAERLLRYACRVARAEDALLTVLCVVAAPLSSSPVVEMAPSTGGVTLMRALVRAQDVCREAKTRASFELRHGRDLAAAIVEEAKRGGSALICLSLGDDEPGEAAPLSTVVQSVLASAPCSVLLGTPLLGTLAASPSETAPRFHPSDWRIVAP